VTGARQPLNPVYLSDIFEAGGESLLREVVETFLGDVPRRMETLRSALDDGNWGAAELAAHTIVSASSMLGLTSLSAAARHVEYLTAERRRPGPADLDALQAGVAESRDLLARAVEALEAGGGPAR